MPTAAQDLNAKLQLEAKFRPDIDAYNKTLVLQFTRQFGIRGTAPNFSDADAALSEILNRHYMETGAVFSDNLSLGMPADISVTDDEASEIAGALALFYATRAPDQARIINSTTQNDAEEAMLAAREAQTDAAMEARPISNLETAAIAGATLNRALKGRTESIVITETQIAAEMAKGTEAEVLSGLMPSVTGGSARQVPVEKEWVSVGDSRVRDAHLSADGQTQTLNEPFIVDGEQLRWPGDSTLGASVGNVINCRCSSGFNQSDIIAVRRTQERDA